MKRLRKPPAMVLSVPAGEHPLDRIKQAAFALTGEAYARIETRRGTLQVHLEPRQPPTGTAAGKRAALDELADRFEKQLDLERIRSAIESNNSSLREHILRMAIQGDEPNCEDDVCLSEAQQKELDRLIAEVEAEIEQESVEADPLGVKKTWEETHGGARTDP